MADTSIKYLLEIEALDKASSVLSLIEKKFTSMGKALQDAGGASALSGAELEAAQLRAQAAADSYDRALGAQQAAFTSLQAAMEATKLKQDELAAAQQRAAVAQDEMAAAESRAADVAAAAAARQGAADDAAAAKAETAAQVAREAYAQMASSAEAAAVAVKAAADGQEAALVKLQGADKLAATRSDELAAANAKAGITSEETGNKLGALAAGAAVVAVGIGAVAEKSIKAAANFQTSVTMLATSAGELQSNLGMVSTGMLKIAQDTGTSTDQLAKGMYTIESAGYHGQQGLDVLRAAAEGAKDEQADLGTVTNAVTSLMNSYHISAQNAGVAVNDMIATVSVGKMRLQDFAGSLSAVTPIAAAVGMKFDQVGAAIATMTMKGMSAQQATQDLAHTIRSLVNPNNVQIAQLQQMGVNITDLENKVGSRGLSGTLDVLVAALAKNTKGGDVFLKSLNQSQSAAADLNLMLKSMPPNVAQLSQAYQNGSLSFNDWYKASRALPPAQRAMADQFATLANKADGFNQLLRAGSPEAQTFAGALSKAMGGATSLNTALMLTGANAKDFHNNINALDKAVKDNGNSVMGWSEMQGTLNQQLSQLKQDVVTSGIAIGTALLPAVTKIAQALATVLVPIAHFIADHPKMAAAILGLIGAFATFIVTLYAIHKAVTITKDAIEFLPQAIEGVGKAFAAITDMSPWILLLMALVTVAILIATHWKQTKAILDDVWKGIKIGAEAVAHFFEAIWRPIPKFFDGIWRGVKDGFDTSWKAIKGVLSAIWGGLSAAWNDTGGKAVTAIANAWRDITAPIVKEWDIITSDLAQIWSELVTLWNDTGGRLLSAVGDALGGMVNFFRTNWDTIKNIVMTVLNPMLSFIRLNLNAIANLFRIVWNLVVGIVKGALDIVWGIISAVLSAITGVFVTAWGVIEGVIIAAWNVISGVVVGAMDFIGGILAAGWDLIAGVVRTAWDLITGILNAGLDFIKNMLKVFIDLVTGQWGKLWHDVLSTVTTVWSEVWGVFRTFLGNILSTVVGAVENIWNGFINGIYNALTGVYNALVTVWNTIVNFFSNAINMLYNVGENIIIGLINGVGSMASAVWNAAQNIASNIYHGILSFFGISSPSRLMHTVGGYIMQGLAGGMSDNAHLAQSAMTDAIQKAVPAVGSASLNALSRTLTGALSPKLSIAASGAGLAGAAGAGGTQIYVDMRQSKFATQRDMDNTINQLGRRLATWTMPAAGRAVKM